MRALVATMAIVAASCASSGIETTDHAVPPEDAPSATVVEPSIDGAAPPSSWEEFAMWEATATLLVDEVEVQTLATRHECFDGECSSPMEYDRTDELLA